MYSRKQPVLRVRLQCTRNRRWKNFFCDSFPGSQYVTSSDEKSRVMHLDLLTTLFGTVSYLLYVTNILGLGVFTFIS